MAEHSEDALDASREAAIDERSRQVDAAVGRGDIVSAVKIALDNPPMATKRDDIKEKNAAVVLDTIVSIREDSKISSVIDRLDVEERDVLMKYLYRGLQHQPANSGVFLKWHAALTKKAGVGSIVRVLTDRKTV